MLFDPQLRQTLRYCRVIKRWFALAAQATTTKSRVRVIQLKTIEKYTGMCFDAWKRLLEIERKQCVYTS